MKTEQPNTIPNKGRRTFLSWLWAGLGIVASMEIIAIILSFFKTSQPRKKDSFQHQLVDAGSVEQYKPGSATAFVRGRFYLVHLSSGGFLAISSQCTHLGCSIPWNNEQEKFICPCHSSQFDITGKVLSSPAPRALDLFSVRISNQRIYVDTATKIRRNTFNADQLVFPDKIKTSKRVL